MVKVITPPVKEPVSLDEFKQWANGLPVTAEQEPIVNVMLKAGREEAEAYQNVAYCEQTLQLTVGREEHRHSDAPLTVTLPRPPFRELKSVTAILPDGTEEDVTEQFEVRNDGGLTMLVLKTDGDMPDFCRLQIVYTAGYDTVPDKVKQAILLYATWAWMHRGGDEPIPAAFYALLGKGRVIPV